MSKQTIEIQHDIAISNAAGSSRIRFIDGLRGDILLAEIPDSFYTKQNVGA